MYSRRLRRSKVAGGRKSEDGKGMAEGLAEAGEDVMNESENSRHIKAAR